VTRWPEDDWFAVERDDERVDREQEERLEREGRFAHARARGVTTVSPHGDRHRTVSPPPEREAA
jgi:hypothetical protein